MIFAMKKNFGRYTLYKEFTHDNYSKVVYTYDDIGGKPDRERFGSNDQIAKYIHTLINEGWTGCDYIPEEVKR